VGEETGGLRRAGIGGEVGMTGGRNRKMAWGLAGDTYFGGGGGSNGDWRKAREGRNVRLTPTRVARWVLALKEFRLMTGGPGLPGGKGARNNGTAVGNGETKKG